MIQNARLLMPICIKAAKNVGASKIIVRAASSMPKKFDPNNYFITPRPVTMDDLVEPYGDWKTAYDREIKLGNFYLLRGAVCLAITCSIVYYSGILDDLWMPNLDNIIADTDPYKVPVDKEGRITV